MTQDKETQLGCPVTPQELRGIANGLKRSTYTIWGARLHSLADWLEKPAPTDTRFDDHVKHVQQFLKEMYATMIDPVEDNTANVEGTCRLLLNAARRDRDTINHLMNPKGYPKAAEAPLPESVMDFRPGAEPAEPSEPTRPGVQIARCVLCNGLAELHDEDGFGVWRHADPAHLVICDRYGYPIQVRYEQAPTPSEPTRAAEGPRTTTIEELATLPNPLPSFDARVWARSFMEHNAVNPDIARDEETMVTWFANALMRGYDEHANKAASQAQAAPKLTREHIRDSVAAGLALGLGKPWDQGKPNPVIATVTDEIMKLLGIIYMSTAVLKTKEN